ncbi:MAG: hypothetical protein ABI833_10720 [Acidobacteriota bacterium]
MTKETEKLIIAARLHRFTAAEKEEHRRSFAYGNTKIENSRITRELIDREADKLSPSKTQQKNRG